MKFLFVSVGKPHDFLFADAITEYTLRISRVIPAEWHLISSRDVKQEGEAILKLKKPDDVWIVLDEHGKQSSTTAFAEMLDRRMSGGAKRIVFVIGGAYGLDQSVLDAAELTISLSAMTLPHQLVRVVLAEQVYRALSILRGGKYHHE